MRPPERGDGRTATSRRVSRGCVVVTVAASSIVLLAGSGSAVRPRASSIRFAPVSAMPATSSRGGGFGGLSCPSPRLCVAVGATASGQAGWTRASEGGGAWTWSRFTTLPAVSLSPDFLTAVSCPTPTRCVAVGYAQDASSPSSGYAITASAAVGRSWRWSDPSVLAAGSTGVDRLMGVSCPTSTRCVAVGLNVSEQGIVASAVWNGTSWTWSRAATVPADATGDGGLLSVSCPSASTCVAVGDDSASHATAGATAAGVTTVGTRVHGAWSWSTESVVAPDGSGMTRLTSVSCPTMARCVAVGVDAGVAGDVLVGSRASGRWTWSRATQFATRRGGPQVMDDVTSVACAPLLCVAVGRSASDDPVFADASGPLPVGSWSPVRNVAHGSLAEPTPQAVSCPLFDDCVQVGVTADESDTWSATVAASQPAREVRAVPGNTRATVVWAPPAFDGGERIRSYAVRAEPGGRSCAVAVRGATPNTCTVRGLRNGLHYRFVVTADNGIGESPPSRPSPLVAPSPFQPPVASPFTRAVHELVVSQPDVVTASVYDVLTGQTWTISPRSVQHTASIVKAEILAALLYDEQRDHVQMSSATQALATEMIEDSDNDAAQALYVQVGQEPGLAAFNQLVGLTATTANWTWGFTDTTALDQTRVVRLFAVPNRVLDAASRRFGIGLMRHVTAAQAWGISVGPTAGCAVALKNGWYPTLPEAWQVNSIGWVLGDGRNYVIAILTNHDESYGSGVTSVEAVSQALWRNLAPPRAHRV